MEVRTNVASDERESRAVLRNSMSCVATGMRLRRAKDGSDLASSVDSNILIPAVEIRPDECIERLGTGRHRWFSESVHAPIGRKVEFCFQGPMHLLALYNEGMRRNGETSIDGLHSSTLRSF